MHPDRGTQAAAIPPEAAQRGDWLELESLAGSPPRRAQILDVLGPPGHRHLLTRWEDDRVTLHAPSSRERVLSGVEALGGFGTLHGA